MTAKVYIEPAALAVDLDLAKLSLRVTGNALDPDLTLKIKSITKKAEHAVQRAFITQTWRQVLDAFPDAIRLDMAAPLQSVSSIKYYDADGVLQTLDPADYSVDDVSEPAYVVPATGTAWPDVATDRVNNVIVEYVCGYGSTHTDVPPQAQAYIIGRLYEEHHGSEPSGHLEGNLDSLKVYS